MIRTGAVIVRGSDRGRGPGHLPLHPLDARRVWAHFFGVCLVFASAWALPAPGRAQFGVYGDAPQSLDEAERQGRGIRITGHVRNRIVPEVYTVRSGDTLWTIGEHFFGNPWVWPRLWSYNPSITNPHWIYPSYQLRLLPVRDSGEATTPRPGTTRLRVSGSSAREGAVLLRQQGFLDSDALRASAVIAGSPADHMLLSPFDTAYLQFKPEYRGTPKGEWTVFREIEQAERIPEEQGKLVRIFGSLRIERYDANQRLARATVIEALDPIERGFSVAEMPRAFRLVAPRVADRDLSTEVVAALRPRQLLGAQQVIFVPVGRTAGVQLGNRFFIVRRGDGWSEDLALDPDGAGASVAVPPTLERYPSEVVAEARVVDVRERSSALLVTHSIRAVTFGDEAEMRKGD